MATPTDILTLSQWFSPSFPVGGFAYSHGMEAAIDRGEVQSAERTGDWIKTVLCHGAGWNDCILLAAAYRAESAQALGDVDAVGRALAASKERLRESDLQGAAFCGAVSKLMDFDIQALCYPVAAGRAARLGQLPLDLTAQMYLQSMVSNLAAVAMRLVPLGQSEGQTLISDLAPICIDVAARAMDADMDGLSATAFLTDIAAMKHETQYSRIFRT